MKRLLPLVAVLALAGCGSGAPSSSPSPSADLPVAGADCPGMAAGAQGRNVRFGVAGATNLAGIIGGTGATGIVLSHMSDGNVCQWILSFNELIGKGYKVLAYDSHGSGVSDSAEVGFEQDVVAAVETLRADGATSIVLMGASLGGAARQLAEASTAWPDARHLVTPGSVHGNGIIDPGGDEKLRAAVADFLADHAPPA